MISKKALDEFKRIWREQFGEDISDAKATEEGINLLTMFNAICQPIKKFWAEEYDSKLAKKPWAMPVLRASWDIRGIFGQIR